MALLDECKVYLDITDNDRDSKITQLLNAGYSSMTNTADVVPGALESLNDLVKIALFTYVAKELEPDADTKAKMESAYEKQVSALAMSSAFGDYSALDPEV